MTNLSSPERKLVAAMRQKQIPVLSRRQYRDKGYDLVDYEDYLFRVARINNLN